MTSGQLPAREPAWVGSPPGRPSFGHPVGGARTRWLEAVLRRHFFDLPVAISGALVPTPDRTGHYLVTVGEVRWVAHVKRVSGGADLEVAAAVARHLLLCAVGANAYRASRGGCHEVEADRLFVTVTSYRPGRHTHYSMDDAGRVGVLLGATHRAMRSFPDEDAVRARAREVTDELAGWRERLLAGAWQHIPGGWGALVRHAATRYDPEFSALGDRQCGHGDLSPGNVLFADDGDTALCDFEDSAFCFRPPTFDLGMAVLRFALEGASGADGSAPGSRADQLLEAYRRETGRSPPRDGLRDAIQNLSDHFLVLLGGLQLRGMRIEEPEWRKAAGWPSLAADL